MLTKGAGQISFIGWSVDTVCKVEATCERSDSVEISAPGGAPTNSPRSASAEAPQRGALRRQRAWWAGAMSPAELFADGSVRFISENVDHDPDGALHEELSFELINSVYEYLLARADERVIEYEF